PESILKKIFIESAFVDSYARLKIASSQKDTLSIFESIFTNYGYTAADLKYTIETHSRRKSNVIVVLIEEAVADLENVRTIAQFRNDLNKTWQEKAKEYSKEILYQCNDTLKYRSLDSLKKFKIRIPLNRIGEYEFSYRYYIDSTDLNQVRYFNYHRLDSVNKKNADQSSVWLTYVKDIYQPIKHNVKIDKLDTLSNQIEYEMIYYGNNDKYAKKPNMNFDSIKVTYYKPDKIASKLYFDKVLGIEELNKLIDKANEKNSITLPDEWWKIDKKPDNNTDQ
ncbi:MAG: hypothetical protein RR388_06710, partial [Rikenellaceae bacterium]